MIATKAKYNCIDYVPNGHGNSGYCRLLGYPCLNGIRFGECPRKDEVYYCPKCKKFSKNTTISDKVNIGAQSPALANPPMRVHAPYPKDKNFGCGYIVVPKDPDKWVMKCPTCGTLDGGPRKHETIRKDAGVWYENGREWTCPNCGKLVNTSNIAEYFAEGT